MTVVERPVQQVWLIFFVTDRVSSHHIKDISERVYSDIPRNGLSEEGRPCQNVQRTLPHRLGFQTKWRKTMSGALASIATAAAASRSCHRASPDTYIFLTP